MERVRSILDDITKFVAFFSIFLLIVGYVDILSKYHFFGVDIISYINPSEIITVSFSNIFTVFIVTATIIILGNQVAIAKTGINQLTNRKANVSISRRKELKAAFFYYPIIFLGFWIFYSIANYKVNYVTIITIVVRYLIYISIVRTLFFLANELSEGLENKQTVFIIKCTTILIPSIFMVIVCNNYTDYLIKKYDKPKKLTLELYLKDSSVIVNSDTTMYLGRTQSHFFIWNRENDKVTVLPASEIRKIVE